ncbi:hydroxymethylpyrimidine/phosphomethylpyrimidine kinase [Enterococcus florum]|uniref:pyridoxal kinase n=1 Tax=Enterococcus florum TaxID=2480627 RepID=A0A4P5PGK5_9ENTE|nr:bifunctional hydroxymethylpyrimidine kinase/phosphomethylpyrimidine kinase [Enterococcus florum]GCF92613.1 hydroxymethylpyrimidine/phosphomethylpyrimidine kinase [Enterococcus florum]
MKKAITIAGSDATGGGGLEADLKVFQEFGLYGFAAITSIVTMDPTTGGFSMTPLAINLLEKQIDTIFAGPFDAIKTGLLPSADMIRYVAKRLQDRSEKIVVDPVVGGKGTHDFINADPVEALRKHLLPLAFVTTPNLREAELLADVATIQTKDQMKEAAQIIHAFGVQHVVIKGGTRLPFDEALDLHFDGKIFTFFQHELLDLPYNHGAGCTFAAAITASLAKNLPILEAIQTAIDFTAAAIEAGTKINPFTGHVWHGAYTHAERRMESPYDK